MTDQRTGSGRTALIAGASGLVGSILLNQLLKDQRYEHVIALVRKPLHVESAKLSEVIADFDQGDSYRNWFKGVDDVYCCLGTTIRDAGSKEAFRRVDYTYPLSLAKAAAVAGVGTFVCITALTADPQSRIFYNRIKGEAEGAISSLEIPSIIFIRPSFLIGKRKQVRTGERIAVFLVKAINFLLKGSFRKYRGVSAEAVAKGMLYFANSGLQGVSIIESDRLLPFEKN